jgi:starch synthase
MHVIFVTPLIAPFTNSGDLSELSGALPKALLECGARVTVLAPLFKGISPERFSLARRLSKVTLPLRGETVTVEILSGKFVNCDVPVIFLEHAESFQRDGTFGDEQGDYADNWRRFFIFSRAALGAIKELNLKADLLHAIDWPSSSIPLLMQQQVVPELGSCKTVFTLHDATRQALFDPSRLEELGLGYDLFHPNGIEFHGQVSMLKAALLYADRITTCSPAYAREMQTEAVGAGLAGLFSHLRQKIDGVTLGVDPVAWNPATDHRLAARYQREDLSGKEQCKRALQAELGLPQRPQLPLVVMAGPLQEQTGLPQALEAIPPIASRKVQLAFIGEATAGVAQKLGDLAATHPEVIAFSPDLEVDRLHRVLAGADAILLPYLSQPGGILPLKAMRYGAVPLARAVGGFKDTVVDFDPSTQTGTGICWQAPQASSLITALDRFLTIYRDKNLLVTLIDNGMRQDHGWQPVARKYLEVYERVLGLP